MQRRKCLITVGSLATTGVVGCLDGDETRRNDEEDTGENSEEISTDGEVVAEVDTENISNHEVFEQYHSPEATHIENEEYAVAVMAYKYVYEPGSIDPIEVPENSNVSFYIASTDITHAFTVEQKSINAELSPGKIVKVSAEFGNYDDVTEYEISCGEEFCEDDLQTEEMLGKIRVSPDSAD